MAQLLYGSGLRLMECVRLHVKDIDWSLANTEKGGGEPIETRFLSLLRNVAVA